MMLLFEQILAMSFVGSLVFLPLLCSQYFMKNTTASWRYGQLKWVLMCFLLPLSTLVKMVTSWVPQSVPPYHAMVDFVEEVKYTFTQRWDNIRYKNVPFYEQGSFVYDNSTVLSNSPTTEEVMYTLAMLWVGLLVLGFLVKAFRWYRWKSVQRVAKQVEDPLFIQLLQEEKDGLGCHKEVAFMQWDEVETPLTTGLWSPQILLTKHENSPEQIRKILCHELNHIKSGDLWWNCLLQGAMLLHWYNPVMYLFAKKFREEMEFACDEKVAKTLSLTEKKEYFHTLLDSASVSPPLLPYGVGFSNSKKGLEKRFTQMLQEKTMKPYTKALSFLLMVGLLMGASYETMPLISANLVLEQKIVEAMSADPYISHVEVHIHRNGRVFVTWEDRFRASNRDESTLRGDTQRNLIADIAGVDVRDVIHYTKGQHDIEVLAEEIDTYIRELTSVSNYDHYRYSPTVWESILERVERGEVEMEEVSPDQYEYVELLYTLPRTPFLSVEYPAGFGALTYAQKSSVLRQYNDYGEDEITYFWIQEEEGDHWCEISFPHLYSDGMMVSYDGGESWDITVEPTYFDIDQGNVGTQPSHPISG